MKYFELASGAKMPAIGLGTYKLFCSDLGQAIEGGIEVGYRHFDAASVYENQIQVGEYLAKSSLDRKDLFITSKLWRTSHNADDARYELERTLRQLKVTYLDLFLIHWPNKRVPIQETTGVFRQFQDEGLVKDIGVSNFNIEKLKQILDLGIAISNSQVEFHPSFWEPELLEFCKTNSIVVSAHSPLRGDRDNPVIVEIAKKYSVSPAEIIVSWIKSKGVCVIAKSTSKNHLEENIQALDIELDESDLKKIDTLNTTSRMIDPTYSEF